MKGKFIRKFFCFCFVFVNSIALFAQSMTAMTAAEAQVAREKFVEGMKKHLGMPYEYGAAGPDSFDCSGLIYYVAKESINVKLPRTAKAIYNEVRIIPDEKKEVGDLLFFRTMGSATISHVGVYIGDNKFISALSDSLDEDGQGVSYSQLNSSYWKEKYAGVGQFLPSGKASEENAEKNDNSVEESESTEQKVVKKNTSADKKKKAVNKITKEKDEVTGYLADNILIDASLFFDWSLLSPRQFVFRYRGIDALAHVRYSGWALEPGFGLGFRYNSGLKTVQMPLVFTITFNDYIRAYAGPVISFKKALLIDTDKEIKPSVFPGLVGISFMTPPVELGSITLHGVQDVSYTIYNNLDGSTLSFMDSLAAGLVMYTGIRIVFPASIFGRGK
ncbi:MAG: C40 family peptidase [Treponema sp.]|nr:C40 family peptidase [Treponema sp.]